MPVRGQSMIRPTKSKIYQKTTQTAHQQRAVKEKHEVMPAKKGAFRWGISVQTRPWLCKGWVGGDIFVQRTVGGR